MTDIIWTTEKRRLGDLIKWEQNPRQLTADQAVRLRRSIDEFGYSQLYEIEPDNTIVDGHQRDEVMLRMEQFGPGAQIEVRVASRKLTLEERKAYIALKHRGAMGEWNWDEMHNLYEFEELEGFGFDVDELLAAGFEPDEEALPEDPGADIDRAEELREKWGVESGQLWQLGEHRLICGDCTDAAVVGRVMGGEMAQGIIIDPPYSSGGFQEAGKTGGSIGTRKNDTIQADNLSTRGYRLLLLDALKNFKDVDNLYIFTDWRMWIECFDVSERAGWKVRSMLVWDKEQMGMGLPWRSQHELILFGKQTKSKMMDGKRGNVLHASRTGNENHPTEKPIELIEQIIENTEGDLFVDFFLGSGTTLIACERLNRKCRAAEISPAYCAVAIERWVEMTGQEPVILQD